MRLDHKRAIVSPYKKGEIAMKKERSIRKPAESAIEYLRRGQEKCIQKCLKAEKMLESLGIRNRVITNQLETRAMREVFSVYVAVASAYWSSSEIDAALKGLGCVGYFPFTREFLEEARKEAREIQKQKLKTA